MRITYDCLKDEQIDLINVILKSDVLAILPTGFGKSFIYQILPFIEKYIVIILFPLNSKLYERKGRLGSAAYIAEKDTLIEQRKILVAEGLSINCSESVKQLWEAKFSYILSIPETLLTPEFNYLFQLSRYQDESNKICVVVDECYCVVHWGANFRTKY